MTKELCDMSLEELWALFPVSLVPPDDRWPLYFKEEKAHLKSVLPEDSVERISHIGSTAIGGIRAKNIVDILVEIPFDCDMEAVARGIERCGFIRMSTAEGRIYFNKGYTVDGFAEKVYHLHLRYEGDNDELYFRDYLNDHPAEAKKYEALKMKLWRRFEHDRDAYTAGKTRFVRRLTRAARRQYGGRYAPCNRGEDKISPREDAVHMTAGTVLTAKRIWCIHINKYPLKSTTGGGAMFPYIIKFQFNANGKTYICKKRSIFLFNSPSAGEEITVTYNAAHPKRCRIHIGDK